MFRIRPIIVALCGALTLSAIAADSASAGWFLEGEELAAGSKAALATTAKVDANSTLLVPGLGLSVVCGGSTLDDTSLEIIGANAAKAASLTFLGCNTTAPASGCALEEKNESIPTVGISAEVKGASFPDAKLLVSPQTKSILANLSFSETNTCAFNGIEPVKGLLTLNAPKLQEQQATQPLEGLGSTENNSLEIGGQKAFVDGGDVLLKSATGAEFADPAIPGLVALEGEVRIALLKGEENKKVVVLFENSNPSKDVTIKKNAILGGDGTSWKINPANEQEAGFCKMGQVIAPRGHCGVTTTFIAGTKGKKVGAGNGYIATLVENADIGGGTVKLNGEVIN